MASKLFMFGVILYDSCLVVRRAATGNKKSQDNNMWRVLRVLYTKTTRTRNSSTAASSFSVEGRKAAAINKSLGRRSSSDCGTTGNTQPLLRCRGHCDPKQSSWRRESAVWGVLNALTAAKVRRDSGRGGAFFICFCHVTQALVKNNYSHWCKKGQQ